MEKRRESIQNRAIAFILSLAMIIGIIGLVPPITAEAADSPDTIVIKVSELKDGASCGKEGYIYYKNGDLNLHNHIGVNNYVLELDEDLSVTELQCYGDEESEGCSLTIKGNKKLTINGSYRCLYVAGTLNISGAAISATTTSDYMKAIAAKKINLSGGSTIIKPEGGTVKELDNYSQETIVDSSGKPAMEVEIVVKQAAPEQAAPEQAADETPTQKDEKSSDSGKKSYKNEWVNGQWYDANGKTDYKYKGGWKVDATGWWYVDENGWFPTNMWQKIDGDWYFFHEDGYMAENEYAGKWELYSEGYWWVGSDGRWDGSEPGVWRLVGTKWWFKDSTGWYAKGKWYKIGGKWYEFDNDGWWVEPE